MRITLGMKLTGAFLIMALLALALGGVGYWFETVLGGTIEDMYNEDVRGIDRAADISAAAADHYRGVLEYSLSQSEADASSATAAMEEAETRFRERMSDYTSQELTDTEAQLLTELDEAWSDYREEAQAILSEGNADGLDAQTAIAISSALRPAFGPVVEIAADVVQANRDSASQGNEEATALAKSAQQTLLWLVIAAVVVAVVLGYWLTISIIKPVKRIGRRAAQIAAGDIHQDLLSMTRKDEIGQLSNAFDRMIESLSSKTEDLERIAGGDLNFRVEVTSDEDIFGKALAKMRTQLNEVLTRVSETVEQVSAGADEVSSASQTLSEGATEQASSVEEITSSMVELSSQAQQNTTNASGANTLAQQARQQAEQGDGQMQKLLEHMRSIDASSEEIKKIITVIDDIAFQINLLALNANVEAARAGQHGRGFAVVADEVRNLAVRSASSVKETSEKIEQSIATIQTGNEIADETARQFREIVGGVSKVANLMEEITAASEEQSTGLEQINSAVEQIDQVTQSNTAGAEQTASAAEELSAQSKSLHSQTEQFVLDRTPLASAGSTDGDGGVSVDGLELTPEMVAYLKQQMAQQTGNAKRSGDNGDQRQTKKPAQLVGARSASTGEASDEQPQKGIALSLEDDDFDEF
ncbi:MAG: methyl-accepting chemotaxis protein [Alkalispirochaeta sp.]